MAAFTSIAVWAKSYTVTSPDGMLEATVDDTGKAITLGVSRNGVELIKPSRISLDIEGRKKSLSIVDRREAIRAAAAFAQPGDVILIAGKGHEDYQEIKGVKHHFDDREVVKEVFACES